MPCQFDPSIKNLVVRIDGWPAETMGSIVAPVLVIVGDADMVRPEHAVEMHRLLPHSSLAILPDKDHLALMEPHRIPCADDRGIFGFSSAPRQLTVSTIDCHLT